MEADPEINLEITYQAANRLATHDGDVVQFDVDGNMTKGPLSGELVDFVFDSRNRLIQAGSMVYRYDAENQRIGVDQTSYVVNSQPALSQVLVKTQADGTQAYYVYGLGLIGQEQLGVYLSYHFDLRGSTVALTDETVQVVERFQYSPYGLLMYGDASITPFLFNGMYGVMSDDNGLYYMRARYYSPEIRRFVNQDVLLGGVIDGQTLNRYAFVTGQPVNYIDPFGLLKTFLGTHFVDDNIQEIQKVIDFIESNYPELTRRKNGDDMELLLIPYLSLHWGDFKGIPLAGFAVFNNIVMPTKMCELGYDSLSAEEEYLIYTTLFHEFLHPYLADRLSFFDNPTGLNDHILGLDKATKYHEWIRKKAIEILKYYQLPERAKKIKLKPLPTLNDYIDVIK